MCNMSEPRRGRKIKLLHGQTVKISSDEEADREVEAICAPSEYYQVRSHLRHRRRYLMYNALDDIGEITQYKRSRNNSPSVQGPPVEH